MSTRKKRPPLGQRLIRSMEGGLTALRNDHPLPLTEVPRPPDPEPWNQDQIVRLRHRLRWSQAAMARWLNVSSKTVQSWEQGSRKPTGSALRLLQLFNQPLILQRMLPSIPHAHPIEGIARKQIKPCRTDKHSVG